MALFFDTTTQNGTVDDDFLLGTDLGGPNNTLNGDGGDDLIWGDSGDFASISTFNPTMGTESDNAVSIDASSVWSLRENPDIQNATSVPHTTVYEEVGASWREFWYSVTIDAGETITADVDYGEGPLGKDTDLILELYDSTGTTLVSDNDDASTSLGAGGSSSPLDSFLETTVGTAGTYLIRVIAFGTTKIAPNSTFLLNMSVTGHAATGSTIGGDDVIGGGIGNDTLYGMGGNDTITGGDDDDVVIGGSGADSMDGGAGIDTLSYADSDAGVDVDLQQTSAGGGGHSTGDTYINFENLIGSGFNDTLTGDSGENTLIGGVGADQMYGGADDDTVDYSASGAGVEVRLNGSASSGGDAQGDRLFSIENVVGSDFADTITGNGAGNTLDGGGGSDSLVGSGDEDLLIGSSGGDEMRGNAGNDTLEGGANNDRLFGDEDEDMIFGGANNDRVFGGGDNDTIEGGDGDDELFGTLGADLIYGGDDDDLIAGNAGADILYGGDGDDTINGNEFADVLYGGANNDTLNAGSGLDALFGGDGEDVLNGGASSDVLTGGGGADTFEFTVTGGIDRITDWQDGVDQLDFTADGLGFGDFTVSTFGGGAGTSLIGGGYVVFLEGITTTDIDGSDFL
ncbi:MAG: calcium-binding protein [Pseudomonadota bacterium]